MTKSQHGMSDTPIYVVWRHMRTRCSNPKKFKYSEYGGRGIKVCERWEKFENFYADMGERPEGQSLDRIDCNGDYEPSNCRWATSKQQSRNSRSSLIVECNGIKMCLADWCELLDLNYKTVHARLWKRKEVAPFIFRPTPSPWHLLT